MSQSKGRGRGYRKVPEVQVSEGKDRSDGDEIFFLEEFSSNQHTKRDYSLGKGRERKIMPYAQGSQSPNSDIDDESAVMKGVICDQFLGSNEQEEKHVARFCASASNDNQNDQNTLKHIHNFHAQIDLHKTHQRGNNFSVLNENVSGEDCSSDLSSSSIEVPVKIPKLEQDNSKLMKAKKPKYCGESYARKIYVATNFYCFSSKQQDVYHYNVDIVWIARAEKSPSKELSRLVIFELLKFNKNLTKYTPIFDGKKNLFTSKPLPITNEKEFEVYLNIESKSKKFLVTIKPVVKKRTTNNVIKASLLKDYISKKTEKFPEQMRLVYEAILSHRKWDSSEIKCGFSFFSLKQSTHPLGDGLELLQGYNQNIRFTESGAAVVINVATCAFHRSGHFIDYVSEILKKNIRFESSLASYEIKKLNRIIHGVRIKTTHGKFPRKYYIQKVIEVRPREHKFTMNDENFSRTISVEEYFKNTYNHKIRYNNLPLLQMKKKNVTLPFEVCEVLDGQRFANKNIEGNMKANMIRHAAIPPEGKFEQIQSYAEKVLNFSSPVMTEYGLEMDLSPVSFKTRVLEQPEIKYSSAVAKPNDRGMWEVCESYLNPAAVKKWMIINFVKLREKDALENLKYLLCKVGNRVGLCLTKPEIRQCYNDTTEEALTYAKDKGMQFVVIVISKHDYNHLYHEIKYICDIKLGLICQCVDESLISNFKKFSDKTATNICLKINTKLEGVNHTLSEWPLALEKEAVLIIGADVVHSGDLECSSIAAVVGCVDYNVWKYAVSCRALTNPKENGLNQEIILTLNEMVVTILKAYYRSVRKKPQKILFYRDGISEGQFKKALEIEIPMIKKACQSLQRDVYQPPITYVIVQKRIQARFKPVYVEDGVGRMQNVPPGTVIDRYIVDPVNYDFYLVSHEGIQGTSKPVYYTVLFDENGVKPDVIQKLTFYLCHVFARCNRSISIPAPVKYADLLAYRAMNYVKGSKEQLSSEKRYSRSKDQIPEFVDDLLKNIERIKNKMFFV